MTISRGLTTEEIRELVHEYELLAYGSKGRWRAERNISTDKMRTWRAAVFDGDLDRGLVPREGSAMTVLPSKRTAFEKERARERALQAAEVARLNARVKELEDTNAALGKAIGLLHSLSELEPDETQALPAPSSSSGTSSS